MKMKKIIYFISGTLFFLCSCADLDVEDKGLVGTPWNEEPTATMYMNTLYDKMLPAGSSIGGSEEVGGGSGFGGNANYCDESDGGTYLLQGRLASDKVGNFSLDTYAIIRNINLGIEDCISGGLSQTIKDELLGQMYFMRAYMYFELTKLYGGVPIITKALQPGEDELNWPRNTAKECFEQIIKDLDSAIEMAPSTVGQNNRGRVTKAVAAALKGRVYLTFASNLFNPQNDQNRWLEAYNANVEAKNYCQAIGRKLYQPYNDIFLNEDISSNTEIVWVVPFEYGYKTHGWENSIRPSQMCNRKTRPSANPTWELTEAFPMIDGKPIGESSNYTYDIDFFWQNRDPRFAATIVHNGRVWALDNIAGRKQWTYKGFDEESTTTLSNIGVFCAKGSNEKVVGVNAAGENASSIGTDWIEIRYAEVLMNLAECANEINKQAESYKELYDIRDRAGILKGDGSYGIPGGMNKEQMREFIMKERFIEFAFENKRFWDMRRRLMFTQSLGSTPSLNNRLSRHTIVVNTKSPYTLKDMNGEKNNDGTYKTPPLRNNIDVETEADIYFTITKTQRDIAYPLNYLNKYYFFDVPTNILQRSLKLEQTIGWVDGRVSADGAMGTFDPLSDQGGTPWKNNLE